MHLGSDGRSVQEFGPLAELLQHARALLEVCQLMWRDGHVELTGRLELSLDAVAGQIRAELLVVAHAEALDRADLVREADPSVLYAMRERVVEEAPVAGARATAAAGCLEDHDLPRGGSLPSVERSPQAGETTADDQQVALHHRLERMVGLPLGERLLPVGNGLGSGEREPVGTAGRAGDP